MYGRATGPCPCPRTRCYRFVRPATLLTPTRVGARQGGQFPPFLLVFSLSLHYDSLSLSASLSLSRICLFSRLFLSRSLQSFLHIFLTSPLPLRSPSQSHLSHSPPYQISLPLPQLASSFPLFLSRVTTVKGEGQDSIDA